MVASAIFITDLSGKAIISRNYRGDVPLTKAIERFARYLSDVEEETKKPVFHVDMSGDVMSAEDVGGTGPGGETFVYVAVSTGIYERAHFQKNAIGTMIVKIQTEHCERPQRSPTLFSS